jgi:amino acid transporter
MTAGWDNAVPRWFTVLHPRWKTPVNSILFVAAVVMALTLLSMLGVREQEASQLLTLASIVHYAIAYVALFALPVFGRRALRSQLPPWIRIVAAAGLGASLVSLLVSIYPVVDVVSRTAFAVKIAAVVAVSNLLGFLLYRAGRRRALSSSSEAP